MKTAATTPSDVLVRIFLSSPSDVGAEHKLAQAVIDDWNETNGDRENAHITCRPWRAVPPYLNKEAQDSINKKVIDKCHLLVAIFWSRIGTPTRTAKSGTVEEVMRRLAANQPVFVYFSKKPIPHEKFDSKQVEQVKELRAEFIRDNKHFADYDKDREFKRLFKNHLGEFISDFLKERRENPQRSKQHLSSGSRSDTAHSVSLTAWLRQAAKEKSLPFVEIETNQVVLENCTLLSSAPSVCGYSPITVIPEGNLLGFPQIANEDKLKFEQLRQEIRKQGGFGRSAMVTAFSPEISEADPKLHYCTIGYEDWKAFADLVSSKEALARYKVAASNILSYDESNKFTIHPNCLSTGIVVIVGDKEPLIVIGHRRSSGTASPSNNVWGVSVAEQFKPEREQRKNRSVGPDFFIEESAIRGLKEELLGVSYDKEIKLDLQAFARNDKLFYFFIAIADLRPLSFKALVELWQSDSTIDRDENNALAGIPFQQGILQQVLECNNLTEKAAQSVKHILGPNPKYIAFEPGLVALPDNSWKWQRGSLLRLATAQWYLEQA